MALYAEMPNGVRLEFPDGTTPDVMQAAAQDYLKQQGQFGAPVAPGVSNQPAHSGMEWTDVASNAVKNIAPSAKRAVEDIASMVMHPGDTADALAGIAKGAGQKVWRNLTGGTEVGDSEKYVDAVGDYFKDRYGSMEGFKKSLAYDPVGVLSDVSTVFTGGAGLAKGGASVLRKAARAGAIPNRKLLDMASLSQKAGDALSKVGSNTDPLSLAIKGGDWAVHNAFGKGYTPAMRLYQAALKPTTGLSNNAKARFSQDELLGMLREGVDKGIPITTHGENKANAVIGGINDKIDAAIDAADAAGLRVSPSSVANRTLFSDARAEIAAGNVPGADLEAFDNAVLDYYAHHANDDTVRAAQEGKKATYRQFQKAYQNNAAKQASGKTEAAKELASQQRQLIGEAVDRGIENGVIPDNLGTSIHNLNAEEGRVIGLRDAIGRAVQRGGNKSAFSVLPAMLYGAGTGDWGSAFLTGAALPLLTSPGFQSHLAIGMDRAGKGLEWAAPGLHVGNSTAYGVGRGTRINAANRKEKEDELKGLLKLFNK